MTDVEKVEHGHHPHNNGADNGVLNNGAAAEEQQVPPHANMTVGQYLGTRLSSLKPPMNKTPNPFKLLGMLNRMQWAFFGVAFFAWTWDAFDFFTVSLTVSSLAKQFGKTNTDITWGITLVLMFRSVGSILFGIAADRYGRKWPFILNNVLFIILELKYYANWVSIMRWFDGLAFNANDVGGALLSAVRTQVCLAKLVFQSDDLAHASGAHSPSPTLQITHTHMGGTGFCNTYQQFLACRALFGVAMGGLYGNAAATALEDLPSEARGLMSGILQQGYAFGYLLATAFARGLVNTTSHGWRPLFWFGACPPVLIILWRLMLPETKIYKQHASVRRTAKTSGPSVSKVFLREGKVALRRHWLLLTYLVLLMAGFNFASHGSQDLYPTMLENQFEFSPNRVTVTQVCANLGAMLGGTVVGFCSQIFGRRLSIMVMCVIGGALLYPYTFTSSNAVIAAAFFEQFCVQGAWGVIPIHLMELSPGAFRTFVVGTSYQLGNLVSSASSTIESTIGDRFPLPPTASGTKRYEYGKVICIFMGCVYAYVLLLTFIGPEFLGRKFDVAHDADVREVADEETIHDAIRRRERLGMGMSDEDLEDEAAFRREEELEAERELQRQAQKEKAAAARPQH